MSDTKNSTTKNLFIAVIIVAVIAGIYVLKMNAVNNVLGIGAPASTAAATTATKSADTLVPGGTQPPAAMETPAAAPASPGEANPQPATATATTAAPAPATVEAPAQTPPAAPQTPAAPTKAHGKKAAG